VCCCMVEMGEVSYSFIFFDCARLDFCSKRWIDAESGKRSDVPHHFIYNAEHKNLTILDGKRVKRVVFE